MSRPSCKISAASCTFLLKNMGSCTGEDGIDMLILKEIHPPEKTAFHFLLETRRPFRLLIPFFEKRAAVSRIASSRHRHPCDSCVIGTLALSTSFHLFAPFCASTSSSSLSLLRLFSFASALLSSSSLIHYALPCVSGRAACPDCARQTLPLFKELRDSQRSALR